MGDRTIDDPRTLIPPYLRAQPPADAPPSEPPVEDARPIDEDDDGLTVFPLSLLALGVGFALVGLARLAWNIVEGDWWAYDNFAGFFLLDRSMPYFEAFGVFVAAAGLWRGRP